VNGWTPPQTLEMTKLHASMVTLAQVEQSLAFSIPTFANPKDDTFGILLWLMNMLNGLNEAWLDGTRRYSEPTTQVTGHGAGDADAPTRTAKMFRDLDAAFASNNQRAKCVAALRAKNLGALADKVASLPVDTMNRDVTLYGKADTVGRTVIGPHGSLEHSITSLQVGTNYALEFGYEALVPLLAKPGVIVHPTLLKEIVFAHGTILEELFRVHGMEFGCVLPDDDAVIRADEVFGPLHRGFDFFRVIVEAERLGGRAEFPTVNTARTTKIGAASFYQTLLVNVSAWQQAIGSIDSLFFSAYGKIANSWVKVDNWYVAAVSSFPFTIPPPPVREVPAPAPSVFPLTIENAAFTVTVAHK
jgi:hypothetical protein